jgi:hypothetical protein
MKSREIKIRSIAGRESRGFLRGIPETCLLCGAHLEPFDTAISTTTDKLTTIFPTIYHPAHCSGRCGRINIAAYALRMEPGNVSHYELSNVLVAVPSNVSTPEIGSAVKALSPDFVLVYQQALVTEFLHLVQLTGMGLRKALEVLVKDYAISRSPGDKAAIEKKVLGQCIDEYLKDDYLRECARRATWLGNDETHYSRRWQNHDVEDLKQLIRLTLSWLENSLLSEKYLKEMPK